MTRRGFTLVEVLVSVGVVAVLVGLLAPTLAGAREAARSAACMASLRELQAANEVRASDHADRYAPAAVGIASSNLHRWHGARAAVGEPFTPEGGALTAYLGGNSTSAAVRACPTFAAALDAIERRGGGFERGCGGYGYNAAFVGAERRRSAGGEWAVSTDRDGSRRAAFASPSDTASFADAALAADAGLIEYSFLEPRFWPEWPAAFGARPDPSAHFRHGPRAGGAGSVNVAWLDGRVSSESRTFSAWSGVYATDPARAGLGWFGADDSNALFDYE